MNQASNYSSINFYFLSFILFAQLILLFILYFYLILLNISNYNFIQIVFAKLQYINFMMFFCIDKKICDFVINVKIIFFKL